MTTTQIYQPIYRPLTAAQTEALEQLTAQWPVGTRVRHNHSGWYGTVVPDSSGEVPGITVDAEPAHSYVPAAHGLIPGAVAVLWDDHPDIPRAWMRPGVLTPIRQERGRKTPAESRSAA